MAAVLTIVDGIASSDVLLCYNHFYEYVSRHCDPFIPTTPTASEEDFALTHVLLNNYTYINQIVITGTVSKTRFYLPINYLDAYILKHYTSATNSDEDCKLPYELLHSVMESAQMNTKSITIYTKDNYTVWFKPAISLITPRGMKEFGIRIGDAAILSVALKKSITIVRVN